MSNTGSLVRGAQDGLAEHLKSAGNVFPKIFYVNENPDAVLHGSNAGSDIAINAGDGIYYLSVGGSTWVNMGSTT